MRQFIRNFGAGVARLYLLPWYFLSGFVPRRNDLWVFGSWGGQRFADNSAAFFRYCQANIDDRVELIWISHRFDVVLKLRTLGFKAYWWWSPVGMFKCLRARLYLFDCFAKDINFWMSRGAMLVNLWSGVPLKSFERDIDNPNSRYYRLFHGSPVERLVLSALMPWHAVRPDLVIATSDETQAIIARAFDISEHAVVITGLPRTDQLLTPAPDIRLPAVVTSALKAHRRIFVYLPTFRDSGRPFADFDWSRLDDLLEQRNACVLIKFHPVDKTRLQIDARNVHVLDRHLDIYHALPHTAALISDYSSIIWDYLLLRRPVILFVPDLDDFAATSRSLNFNLRELAVGPVCRNFDQLTDAIRHCCDDERSATEAAGKQAQVSRRFHTYPDAESSRRVLEAIEQWFPVTLSLQPGLLVKLRYKFRYNSWPRLAVNALKRIGITVLPYYVFRRDIAGPPKQPNLEGYEFDELTAQDMPRIARLPMAHSDEQTYRLRLRNGQRCFAMRQGSEIFAFCWMDPGRCNFAGERFTLQADEVYIYDIYTTPSQRGRNLAPILNACYTERLRAEGIRAVFGVVDSMNRSSLNYVKKIGSQVQRKNLYLNVFGLLRKSIVLEVFVDAAPNNPAEKRGPIT